jgi:hypothetical protein
MRDHRPIPEARLVVLIFAAKKKQNPRTRFHCIVRGLPDFIANGTVRHFETGAGVHSREKSSDPDGVNDIGFNLDPLEGPGVDPKLALHSAGGAPAAGRCERPRSWHSVLRAIHYDAA